MSREAEHRQPRRAVLKGGLAGLGGIAVGVALPSSAEADSFSEVVLTPDVVLRQIPSVGSAAAGTLGQDGRRFDRLGWLNVKDFGAAGIGTNDRPAVQAAIDAVPSGGGVVFFPPGNYGVDCTADGILLPNDKSIVLVGSGNPITVSTPTTLLTRVTGTAALIRNVDGGSPSTRFRGGILNIRINGAGSPGRIAYFKRLSDAFFERVRFGNQAPGGGVPGVEFASAWNCCVSGCHFLQMGNGTANPAVLVSTVPTDPGDGTTGGLYFVNGCEWEKNFGTDLHLGTPGGSPYEVTGVMVTGFKMEGGTGGTFPMVRFHDQAHNNQLVGGRIYHTSGAGAASNVVQNGVGAGGNHITGCDLSHGGSSAGTYYLIDQSVGSLGVSSCHLSNGSAQLTSAWRIGSTVPAPSAGNPGGAVGGANTYANYTAAKRFTDSRPGNPGPQTFA